MGLVVWGGLYAGLLTNSVYRIECQRHAISDRNKHPHEREPRRDVTLLIYWQTCRYTSHMIWRPDGTDSECEVDFELHIEHASQTAGKSRRDDMIITTFIEHGAHVMLTH